MDPRIAIPTDRLRAALADRYDLDRETGHGGMANVYRAYDRRHDRVVAVKVLRPEAAAALGADRFLREIRIAARLQHPNILPLHDSGAADGFLYYVMPFVEGESLRDRLRREQQLPIEDAVQIAREVAEALGYAHAHDIVHRDIKPGNILLSNGHAMVADFGIARPISGVEADALTGAGIAVGTPEYMSPEQSTGDGHVDGRADIYALGCVLYEMLAGSPPFTGASVQSILARHRQDTVPSLRIVRPGLPPAVQLCIEKSLAKVAADRFPTAAAFAASLEAASRPNRRPRLPGGRWWPVTLAVALTTVGAFMAVPGSRTSAAGVAAVVVPFDRPAAPGGATGGPPAHVIFAEALDWMPGLRGIDGSRLISEGGSSSTMPLPDLLRGAARLGGKYLVTGTVWPTAGGSRVSVDVYDVGSGERVVRGADSAGRQDELDGPLGRLALQSIGTLAARERLDLGARRTMFSATTSAAALGNLLQGQTSFSAGDYDGAAAAYRRAIESDSSCGLAYLRLSEVERWLHDYPEALRVAEAGLRLGHRLPTRWTNLLTAQRFATMGFGDSAIAAFQNAVLDDREDVDAWLGLGEALFHHGGFNAHSPSDARSALERTVQLDSAFAPVYDHLADLALQAGDSLRAATYLARMRLDDPSRRVREAAFRLRFGNPEARRSAHEQLRHADRQALSQVIALSLHGAANLPLADTLAGYLTGSDRTPDDRRRGADFRLAALAGQGRWPDAVAAWREVAGDPPFDAWVLHAYLAGFPAEALAGPMLDWARGQIARGTIPDFSRPPWDEVQQAFQAVAHHASLAGDSATIRRLLAGIDAARPATDGTDPARPSLRAALEARLALLGGDSVQAIALLRQSLSRINEPFSWYYPMTAMAPQRRLLADLLARRGAETESRRWRDSFRNSWSVGDIFFAAMMDARNSP